MAKESKKLDDLFHDTLKDIRLDRGIKRVQVRMARHISSGRSLHRSNPQRREARRPAGAYVTAEIEKWGKVIRAANIKPE
jgi:hypothetical protein